MDDVYPPAPGPAHIAEKSALSEAVEPGSNGHPIDPEWHGWGTDSWSLHIGYLPSRKSVCLYYQSGSVFDVLAHFKDEQRARVALASIDFIARLKEDQ